MSTERKPGFYWAWSKQQEKWVVLEYVKNPWSKGFVHGWFNVPGFEHSLSENGETYYEIDADPIPEPKLKK